MIKKLTALMLALTLGALPAVSCAGTAKPLAALELPKKAVDFDSIRAMRKEYPVTDEFLGALDDFAGRTAELLMREGNINYSPLSLYLALSLAELGGADCDALIDLLGADSFAGITTSVGYGTEESTLTLPSDRTEALADQCSKLWVRLCRSGEFTELEIADSVWSSVGIRQDFAEKAASCYYAECFDSLSPDEMSAWIKKHTKGTLAPELELLPDQVLSIINTVYFKGEWTDRFDSSRTESGIFHAPDGDVSADFMQRNANGGFRRGENFTTASLGLKDNGSMTIVLPDEGTDIRELLEKEGLIRLIEGGESKSGDIIWYFPKFSFDCEFSVKELLTGLGVGELFDENSGTAKNITDFEPVTLGDIRQGTHIAVDERGVTASAFTELMYYGAAMPVDTADMRMDRQFLYTLEYGGVIIFAGIVDDPSR